MFYRLNAGVWISNFGAPANCIPYAMFKEYAIPSNAPSFITIQNRVGGCGGGLDSSNVEYGLSGIHCNDNNYRGGYSCLSSQCVSAPGQYQTPDTNSWSCPGYVFLNW